MTYDENNQSDEELVQRLRAGDKQAFVELVHAYHVPMKHFASAIIGEGQAEETVQDAWLTVITKLDSFAGRSKLKTWLYTIVGNAAKTRLRKSKREVSFDTNDGDLYPASRFHADGHWSQTPSDWHDDSPEALLSQKDFQHCLEHVIAALPSAQSAALRLRDEDGLNIDEICNILEVSASNVRVLVHRARIRVYNMIEHFEETGTC